MAAGRDALAELLGEPMSWIQVGEESCQIDADLQTAGGEDRQMFLRIEEKDSVSRVLDRARKSLTKLDEAPEYTNRNYFVLAYGASRRLNVRRGRRDKGGGYRHPRALDVATLFNPDETLIPIESWAMDMDYKGNQDAMCAIKKVTSEFLRGVTFSRIDKDEGSLMFKTPQGDVPMSQLSDGCQSVASWVGYLVYRITEVFGNYRAPLRARGLLLD